jgi:hypothetical protein
MDKRATLRRFDIAAAIISLVGVIVSGVWIGEGRLRILLAVGFGIAFVACTMSAFRNRKARSLPADAPRPHIVKLLDEAGRGIFDWDLERKISVLIGKSTSEETADIDLSSSAFAATVENAHAVLNCAAGKWYLEDISENGTIVLEKEGLRYMLAKGEPCVLESGDIIRIGGVGLRFL